MKAKLEREPPDQVEYLWRWFGEISLARGSSGWGPLPISYMEIDAWSRLTSTVLEPWEVDAIRRLDMIYLSAQAENAELRRKTGANGSG